MNLDNLKNSGLIHKEALEHDQHDFYNELVTAITGFYISKGGSAKYIEAKDLDNEYVHNSWGCRDEDYIGPVDIITAGCSQTYGQGVPVETRWSSKLGKILGASVVTLAVPGWSLQSMVNSVMSYIVKFGKPKVVALYIPDLFRLDFVANKDILDIGPQQEENGEAVRLVCTALEHPSHMPNFSKKPYLHSDVINPEFAAFMGGQSLRFLIEYCKESDIELVYTTWDRVTKELLEYSDYLNKNHDVANLPSYGPSVDYSGYLTHEYVYENNADLASLDCHSDLKDEYSNYFDWGTDEDEHIGVHMHAHVAELFANRLKSIF